MSIILGKPLKLYVLEFFLVRYTEMIYKIDVFFNNIRKIKFNNIKKYLIVCRTNVASLLTR